MTSRPINVDIQCPHCFKLTSYKEKNCKHCGKLSKVYITQFVIADGLIENAYNQGYEAALNEQAEKRQAITEDVSRIRNEVMNNKDKAQVNDELLYFTQNVDMNLLIVNHILSFLGTKKSYAGQMPLMESVKNSIEEYTSTHEKAEVTPKHANLIHGKYTYYVKKGMKPLNVYEELMKTQNKGEKPF